MKKLLLTTISIISLTFVFGQKTEYRFGFSSGLFSFSGRSSEAISHINYSKYLNTAYTNNPYGSKQELCYGVSGTMKRILKNNLVFGLDLAYEQLRSKTSINLISDYNGTSTNSYSANGKTLLNFDIINLEPFVGYRLALNSLSFDITGGVDVGYCLHANEKGKATATDGKVYKTSLDRKNITTDARPRLQFSSNYKNYGFYVGYSFGLVNFKSGYIGGINECYSRIFRFGVTYLIH
ncbi:MAG: outer membrane beta-barrel protein [Williamsia sp.]|nr:outer membrane beta-barrel protein [Williamsia sp.]